MTLPGGLLPGFHSRPSPPQGSVLAFRSLPRLQSSAGHTVSPGLGKARPAGQPVLLRLLGDAERVWASAAGGAGETGGGAV